MSPEESSAIKRAYLWLLQVPALQLNNERFQVPEVIFHPSDVGMQQMGLAEAAVEAANSVHPELRPLLFSNIICTGGTATCPGFSERLSSDLRELVPSEYEVNLTEPTFHVVISFDEEDDQLSLLASLILGVH